MTSSSSIHDGVCPHDCPDSCALSVRVEGEGSAARAVEVRGGDVAPTGGWLCTKVRDYLDWVYHPERVLQPLRRLGDKGSGRFEPITWDEALATIAERWRAIIAKTGGGAILPYSYSGTLGLLQMSVASSRLWNRLGASGLDRAICGAAAERAVQATYGARWAPDLEDLSHCRLLILWGHNPASTAPHVMPAIRQAQRTGCEVVVIDPRRSRSAKSADAHLAPRPGTDAALALTLLQLLDSEGRWDEDFVAQRCLGGDALRARAREWTAARGAEVCGLEEGAIRDLARRLGARRPTMIKLADGLQRHENGGQTVRAVAALPAVLGQVGVRGGGLYYSASDELRWDPRVVGRDDEPRCNCLSPSPRTINMNQLGAALTHDPAALAGGPPVEALYVFGANPAASAPNAGLIARGLAREDLFTVVHELFLTDTARYADIVLPATSQLEHLDVHKAYGHRRLLLNRPAIAPRGMARSNWDTQRAIAEALGFDEPWLLADGESVLREILAASADDPHSDALHHADLDTLWEAGSVRLGGATPRIPFADGRFPTPSGKIELLCESLAAEGIDPLPSYEPLQEAAAPRAPRGAHGDPLLLLSGAAHHFVNSSLYPLERLRRLEGPATVDLNPADARRRGVADGETVRVFNSRGSVILRARLSDAIRSGVAFTAKGYWARDAADQRNVNWTTSDALGDLAGQATFHSNAVWIAPADQETPTKG